MDNANTKKAACISAAVCIMIGLIFIGLMLPRSFRVFRSFDRTVTVRGLSEREVNADRVIWPIAYSVVGNDLSAVYSEVESKNATVISFLEEGGIPEGDISVGVPSISDAYAQEYGNNDRRYRYVATCVVTVGTSKVDEVLSLMKKQTRLIENNILLSSDNWSYKPQFSFEGLNDVKPEMIEEATANARASAEKFAKDSRSRIGKIRTANQGVMSIEDRDSNTPQIKKVRVVTTIVYNLSN